MTVMCGRVLLSALKAGARAERPPVHTFRDRAARRADSPRRAPDARPHAPQIASPPPLPKVRQKLRDSQSRFRHNLGLVEKWNAIRRFCVLQDEALVPFEDQDGLRNQRNRPMKNVRHDDTVRQAAVLLAAGRWTWWHGDSATDVLPAAAVLLDASLAEAFDVDRSSPFHFDTRRRRVIRGRSIDDFTDPAAAEVARRVAIAESGSLWTWLERTSLWASSFVISELENAGIARRRRPPGLLRLLWPDGLDVLDLAAREVALGRVRRAAAGEGNPRDVALALLLHHHNILQVVVPDATTRRARKNLAQHKRYLPPAAHALIDMMESWRRRSDRIGSY